MKATPVGLDIAKQVIQIHEFDEHGVAKSRKRLARPKALEFSAQLAPCKEWRRVTVLTTGGGNSRSFESPARDRQNLRLQAAGGPSIGRHGSHPPRCCECRPDSLGLQSAQTMRKSRRMRESWARLTKPPSRPGDICRLPQTHRLEPVERSVTRSSSWQRSWQFLTVSAVRTMPRRSARPWVSPSCTSSRSRPSSSRQS